MLGMMELIGFSLYSGVLSEAHIESAKFLQEEQMGCCF